MGAHDVYFGSLSGRYIVHTLKNLLPSVSLYATGRVLAAMAAGP